MPERMFHATLGGNGADAVKYGLTLKAVCGLVWTPTIYGKADEHPEIPHCPVCYAARPAYVYRCYNASGRLLYVGCTVAPQTRIQTHQKATWWWPQVSSTRFVVFPDKEYALRRESAAIAAEAPLWNVRGQMFSNVSLNAFQEWVHLAADVEAPASFMKRLKREAKRLHGVNLTAEPLQDTG